MENPCHHRMAIPVLLTLFTLGLGGGVQAQVVERGRLFFNSQYGDTWSCATCHGTPPVGQGKHATTGKSIEPLAPAFNPKRLTDAAKVEKWFRRNCKDVLNRECSAAEKADVLAYLQSLKP